jgi:hypothetical protein
MKTKQDRQISIRIPNELYEFYVKKAIDKSKITGKIETLSDILRESLIKNKNYE